jgi:hypothetical protein
MTTTTGSKANDSMQPNSLLLRLEYARACLWYTFESNRNEERRIQSLLVMSVGALTAVRYIVGLAASAEGAIAVIAQLLALVSSLPLMGALVVGIYGIRSTVFSANSQMLPEWIAGDMKHTRLEYIEQCTDQSERTIIERVFHENHALAQAKVRRANVYAVLSKLFIGGAIPVVIAFGLLLFKKGIVAL